MDLLTVPRVASEAVCDFLAYAPHDAALRTGQLYQGTVVGLKVRAKGFAVALRILQTP